MTKLNVFDKVFYVAVDDSGTETPDNNDEIKETCRYDACQATDPNKLNIHIVAHSHDDAGWLYANILTFNTLSPRPSLEPTLFFRK